MSTEDLVRLSNICSEQQPDLASLRRACEVVRVALGADDAYVLQSGDPEFVRLDAVNDTAAHDIKQKGYWLVWRELSTHPSVPAVMFDAEEKIVQRIGDPVAVGARGTHVGSILPAEESGSELLIARGPWQSKGLTAEQAGFVVTARLPLAYLVGRLLDASRTARQRSQLQVVADISRAFNEAADMSDVLTSLATALARTSGFEWVVINLFAGDGKQVVERAINVARHATTNTAAMLRDGKVAGALSGDQMIWWESVSAGRPFVLSDVSSIAGRHPPLRAFLERAHIVSIAVLPIRFQQETIGTVKFGSPQIHNFGAEDVTFLEALVSQASTIVQGMRLHRDLRASLEALQQRAAELEDTSRIQHYLARTDSLTGLPNRRYVDELLAVECAYLGRSSNALSVIVADLDRFKEINDQFGHRAGDEALRYFASIARTACRQQDVVGRLGGDEFAFVLPGTPAQSAAGIAENARRALRAADFIESGVSRKIRISASFGVAGLDASDSGLNGAVLLERADRALYRAKEGGRDRVSVDAEGASRAA